MSVGEKIVSSRQNPEVIQNSRQIAELMQKLFFNKKKHVAAQIFRDWIEKPSWGYVPEKTSTTVAEIVQQHLQGEATYGFYSHSEQHTCRWLCIDIDLRSGLLADRYENVAMALGLVRQRVINLGIRAEAVLVDFSGSKGFHVWVMIEETPIKTVQNFLRHFLAGLDKLPHDVGLDSFPNPRTDPQKSRYGYPVKLPCGLHRGVEQYSHFIDENLCGVINVLEHLKAVVPCKLPNLPPLHQTSGVKRSRKPAKGVARNKGSKGQHLSLAPPLDQPPLTEDLAVLFKSCKLLRDFRDRPDLHGYNHWRHSGMVLTSLGAEGESWFEYLSSVDQARYDGSHEKVIQAVKEGGYQPPSCVTIGCSHCGLRSPLDAIKKHRKQYRTEHKGRPRKNSPSTRSIQQVRKEFRRQLRTLLAAKANGIHLANLPLGSGKTTIAIDEITKASVRCLFYCPTHKLGQEIMDRFGRGSIQVLGLKELQDRGVFDCPHHEEIEHGIRFGLSPGHYCSPKGGKCKTKVSCAYLRQYDQAENASAVVLTHNHLNLGHAKRSQLFEHRDLLVIDENFAQQYRQQFVVTKHDLECLKKALYEANVFTFTPMVVQPLLRFLASNGTEIMVPSVRLYPKYFKRVDLYFRKNLPGNRNVLREIYQASVESTVIRKGDEHSLTVNLPASLPRDIPVLVLDATAKAEDYELLLKQSVSVLNPAEQHILKKFAKIVQVVSGGYSNSSLLAHGDLTEVGTRVLDFVSKRIRVPKDTGIICTKQMEDWIRQQNLFPGCHVLHFNALRGLNDMTEVRDLFVIGYQGISYKDIANNARILFDQQWNDGKMADELKAQKAFQSLNTNGFLGCDVKFLKPENPYIQSFFNLTVKGEVEQAVGRARIYSDCGKSDRIVYLITNTPTSVEIDEIMELTGERMDRFTEAAKESLDEQGRFDRREFAERAGVTERYVRKIIDEVVVRLDLKVIREDHGRMVYSRRGG